LRGVLTGLLAAVSVLALAVVALDAIVWIRTMPAVVPTGPDVTVDAAVSVVNGRATASLKTGADIETLTVDDQGKTWQRTVHFGESIELDVVLTVQAEDENTGELGSAACSFDVGGSRLRGATVSVQNGLARCSFTNDGKG
jgi:hypothetical protein